MCGIFGCVGWDGPAPVDAMHAMDRRLVHRGPDETVHHLQDGIALGSRRLRIIDPDRGSQPFTSEDGSVVVVCNGEVYNHEELRRSLRSRPRFRSDCDVEVLPHLYLERGVGCFRELNGQFAMAIHDRRRDSVLLVRDRFGICPLYYRAGPTLRFASEISALLAVGGAELNLAGLDQAFTLPSVVSPCTMFEGIASVRPGHYVEIDRKGRSEHEYWDLVYPLADDLPPVGEQEDPHVERIVATLDTAVRRRLRADAPIGLYVSGGLDSALIAGMAVAQSGARVTHTLSIGFPQAELDESAHQAAVVRQLPYRHERVPVTVEDICRGLETAVRHSEVPLRESYNVASLMLARAAHRHRIRVVLSGEGADELFAGYSGYRFDQLRAVRGAAAVSPTARAARAAMWGDPDYGYDLDVDALRAARLGLYSDALRAEFPRFDATATPLVRPDRIRGRHVLHRRSYLDVKLRMADHLLGDHGDRMTMASSVEGRYPFLDPDVVDTAMAVPPDLKLRDLEEKYVLKRAARGRVPDCVLDREKFPFTAPHSPYLVRHAEDFVRDRLASATLRRQGLFDPTAVAALVDGYAAADYPTANPLRTDWLMLVLTTTMLAESAAECVGSARTARQPRT